jgi:hypothetical protein
MKAHGIAVPDVLASTIDLKHPIQNALAVPLESYGLKEVAGSLGYTYRHPQLDGFIVAHDYLDLAKAGKPIPQQLLEYNEDDVRSLQYVVSKVQALCGYGGPPGPKKHKLTGAAQRSRKALEPVARKARRG